MHLAALPMNGRILRELRFATASHLTQADIAKMLGVKQAQVSQWETGARKLRINQEFLSRFPADVRTRSLKEYLIERGVQALLAKQYGLHSAPDNPQLFGVLPKEYVQKNFKEISQMLAADLKKKWL